MKITDLYRQYGQPTSTRERLCPVEYRAVFYFQVKLLVLLVNISSVMV
jgi:hypothetical protein